MLVSKPHKKLLLNLRDPDRITTVIPSAKTLVYKGKTIVAVPHKLDEVRVLRNLGFDTPAPVSSYYEWPGRYKPFAHQQTTVEFLTTNPRAFCLNGMGCIAGDELVRVSRKGKSMQLPLSSLFNKFHSLDDKGSWRVRSLMGDRFGMNKLLDVLHKGVKPTLRITLADGKTFRCTEDHRIARPDGSWSEAGDLVVGDALVTNGRYEVVCPECSKTRTLSCAPRHQGQVCMACKGKAHRVIMSGENNPSWKGGRWTDPDGYVRVLAHGHHRADRKGYVYEHILVAEGQTGHPITKDYHVHHINGAKDDNRPENLEVLLASEHHRQHDPYLKLDGTVSAKGGIVVVLPKQSPIVSITDGGETHVYDLCMEAPHHNFVVNGVVVHNSGKTISVLWAFDFLRREGLVNKMLVISPLSTLERAWGDEIFRHFPDMTFTVLHGGQLVRSRRLADDFDIYIINHDGIKSKETLDGLIKREGIDLVVIDEIASFRNASTERWKALNKLVNGETKKIAGVPTVLVQPKMWVWGLTGTPTPNGPTDAWAQCRLINPTRVPQYFGNFRDAVMSQVNQFKYIPRQGAMETVMDAMQPAIRFAREDCIDLPPTTFITRQTTLTPEQQKAYNEMMTKFKTEHDGGEITAVNEAVKLNKLIQICCGVAYGTNGDVLLPAKPRIDLVKELIEESEGKVLVFVPLTAALESLAKELRTITTVETVHGETSKSKRDKIFQDFQQAAEPRVMVANSGTLSHGLTLTAASTIIWFAPIHSNETYQQANARIVRPGQKRNTLIVNIEATNVERKIYERLQGKQKMQGLLLDLIRDN